MLWLARPGVAQGPAAPAAQLPPATAVAPLHPPAAPAPSPPPVVFLGRSARAHWAGGVALTVLGAAATGAAVWLTLDSHAAREQARAHCSAKHPNICSPEGVRLQDRVQRDSLAALGVGVAAVPMVGLGLLSLLVAPGNWDAVTTSDAAVQVVPVVGPAPGLALQGTF
ncbi:MAG: hypothetical protein FJ100_02870 [Deltaproteobacteria bacterium]|nr:hypothetical protein [Deltaproteobacteria bacterium]